MRRKKTALAGAAATKVVGDHNQKRIPRRAIFRKEVRHGK
jgi:hypothetical protein